MSLRTALEIGLGNYLGQFYAQLVADTPAMEEFIARGLAKSIVWVPGRMIDQVESMIAEYRKNDNEKDQVKPAGEPGMSSKLPVILVAMSKDFTPSMPDFGVARGTAVDVMHPDDPHGRAYKVRVSVNDYRAQVVIAAGDTHSSHSLAMQFHLWANEVAGRRFKHMHQFAGLEHEFPAVLENIDMGAVNSPTDNKALTLLIADMTVRASIPMFQAPKADEPNDGKPVPAGYPVITSIETASIRGGFTSRTTLDENGEATTVMNQP